MSGSAAAEGGPDRPDAEGGPDRPDAEHGRSAGDALAGGRLGGGMARAVRAGVSGEAISAEGVLATIGGWRGVAETLLPGLLFLAIFIPTRDARLSALIPGAIAVILVAVRLIRRETLVSAVSGVLGVGVAVLITLITGRGVDYYLSGFVINTVWAVGLLLSILVGWPLLGLVIGLLRGDIRAWRREPRVRRAANLLTLLWLALFVARLAVQLPLYLGEQVAALGVARLVMGTPLFVLFVIATWFAARRVSSDDSTEEIGENTGQTAASE